jgi:peptidoglycan/LPS O-acetylase OafA/YrhL
MRDESPLHEYRPLCWVACLGGLLGCVLFALAHDPKFVGLSAIVALVGGCGVIYLMGRR